MEPQISIIIPIFNVEEYLRQCLDSVVNQTYHNLEIILVDDGSPDNCGMICDEYAAQDGRIRVIHKENEGVSVARNIGIEKSRGEWIMFVDPDDWLELDCCEKMIECASGKAWDIVYFQARACNGAGKLIKEYPKIGSFQLNREMIKRLQMDSLADYVHSLGFESTAPWTKLYRRSMLSEHNCRFPVGLKRRQDVIFNLYCMEYIEQAYYLDYAGYNCRLNESSVCRRRNLEMLNILVRFLREAEIFVQKKHGEESEYCKMLGVLVIAIQKDLEATMFFHPGGHMGLKEYRGYMEQYYDDEVVKRYLNKCSIKDFRAPKDKVRFILISKRHIYLYYYLMSAWQKVKTII